MGSENAKVRVGIYIEKAILEQADGLLPMCVPETNL